MKVRFLILVMLLTSSSLLACSPENKKLVFSCDEEVDMWVRKNLNEIQILTREQFLEIGDFEHRMAAYIALTPEQKRRFWVEKVQETLLLDWSERESVHIRSLLNFLENTEAFENIEPDGFEQRGPTKEEEVFLYKWENYAREELGWCSRIIVSVAYTLYPVTDTVGGMKIPKNSTHQLPRSVNSRTRLPNCNCAGAYDCWMFGSADQSCTDRPCISQRRCGPLGTSLCTGVCSCCALGDALCERCCPLGERPRCPFPAPDYSVFFPHPRSIYHFFNCINGVAYCFECPAGLVWNARLETCRWY